jgi:hydroxymethylpyrimidine pyrophosphatase-like HAD family hydrolase
VQVISNELIMPFDVDETLLLKADASRSDNILLDCPHDNSLQERQVHEAHVKLLRDKKARGYTIIVWSARGHAWAKSAVEALGLQHSVDLVMTKPTAYVDDLPVEQWMPYRIFVSK